MKTLTVGSTEISEEAMFYPLKVRKVLLTCGLLSSLLYIGMDIFASTQWEGYNYLNQAFSELTAIEAPTRSLMVLCSLIPYNLLVLAFAVGVWASAGRKRVLRIVAGLLVAHATTGFIGGVVFPMHSRGQTAMTLTDTMHIIATMAEVLSMLLFIGFGAAAFGKWFRRYSIATILLLILGGILAGMGGSRLAAGLPTPWMGVTERINIYATMLWIAALSITLLRGQSDSLERETL